MRSRLLAVAAVLLALAILAPPARADYVTGLNPRGDNFLALRTGPGTEYRMILRMGPDTVVTVLERRGQWLRVELEDGTRGWAFGKYVEPGFPPGLEDESSGGFGEGDLVPRDDSEAGESAESTAVEEPPAISGGAPTEVAADAWRAPLEEVLFEGEPTGRFLPHSAGGGAFDRDARFSDGTLLADVAAGNGWGKVGILSNDALVWFDAFRDDAVVRVTFTLGPDRTTGFGLALAEPGWGGVAGNDSGYPGMRFYWIREADGASARRELHVDPHPERDFWLDAAPSHAPREVTFVLRPGRVAIEVDGAVVAERPAPALRDGAGLRIYAFSHAAEMHGPAKMALTGIRVSRQYPTVPPRPASTAGVEPLPVATIFDGTPDPAFEPAATAGGDFAAFAQYVDGALAVDVPGGHSWGKTGLISAAPLVVLDKRARLTPTRMTLTLDPRHSTSFTLAFSTAKAVEMWLAHDAWFSFVKLPGEPFYTIGIHQSAYRQWTRPVPAEWIETYWDGRLEYDLADNLACMRIPGGPALCAEVPLGVGQQLYATILAHGPVQDAPASMTLKRITQGLVTPPGMTEGERWSLVPTDEFDPGQFLDELGSLLP